MSTKINNQNCDYILHPDLFLLIALGAIQCYVMQWGGGGVLAFPEKSVMKVYGSTLLALRGDGQISRKNLT